MPNVQLFDFQSSSFVNDALNSLSTNAGLNNGAAGSKVRAVIETFGPLFDKFASQVKQAQLVNLIAFAIGDWLDAIGEVLGVRRLGSNDVVSLSTDNNLEVYVETGTFGDINNGYNIIIPAGTELSTSPFDETKVKYYVTLFQTTLLSTDSSAYLAIRAKDRGTAGNTSQGEIKNISFYDYVDRNNNSLKVRNLAALVTGIDKETDDNYRYRINNGMASLISSNETAIRIAAYSVPGVADVQVNRYVNGVGTAEVLIQSIYPTVPDNLVAAVNGRLLDVTAVGNYVYAAKPVEVGVSMEISIRVKSSVQVSKYPQYVLNIQKALFNYINNIGLGASLYITEIVQRVMETSSDILDMGTPNKPVDSLFIFKKSKVNTNITKRRVDWNYLAARDEKLFVDNTLETPIKVTVLSEQV